MGPRASQDLLSPYPIMAPGEEDRKQQVCHLKTERKN